MDFKVIAFLFLLILTRVSVQADNYCSGIPMFADKSVCFESLKRYDLGPVCSSLHCEEVQLTNVFRQVCSEPGGLFVQSINCCNPTTNQWIEDLPQYKNIPLNNILSNCEQLSSPWSIGTCYCCCSNSEAERPVLEDDKAVFSGNNCNVPLIALPDDPDTYVSFFTSEQASLLKLAQTMDCASVEYLFSFLRGFYPDVSFSIDEAMEIPNIYAFKQDNGSKVILLSGGLIRTAGLSIEGLAMMIGHALGRFSASADYNCVIDGDYFAFGTVSRTIWFGNDWFEKTKKGLTQIQQLFNFLGLASAEGNCKDPGIQCRIQAMQNGMAGGVKSVCDELLSLNNITVNQAGINLIFNLGIEDNTAVFKNQNNYEITPKLVIEDITLDQDHRYILHLSLSGVGSKLTYKVCLKNLISVYNTKLNKTSSCSHFVETDSSFKDEKRNEL